MYTRKCTARVQQPDGTYGPATYVLVGADPEACEAITRLPEGRSLKTEAVAPRDGGRHRYVMKLFSLAHAALPEGPWQWMSFDTFRKALTIDAGYYDLVILPGGDRIKTPLSLSYGSMNDATHKRFVDDLIRCLCQRWIPGLDHEAFTNEIMDAIA